MNKELQQIEIMPGYSIRVSDRYFRKKVNKRALLRGQISDSERRAILEATLTNGTRKYSKAMLDEAVRIAMLTTVKEAEKITRIKYWSIVQRKRELFRAQELKSKNKRASRPSKLTLAQKRQCIALAMKLLNSGETIQRKAFGYVRPGQQRKIITVPKWTTRKAFIEAGKRLGMNGESIDWQYRSGAISL